MEMSVLFVTETCCNCHITYAVVDDFQEARQYDGAMFYCPNGHPQHYTKSQKSRLEAKVRRLESARDWYHGLYQNADRSRNAYKGHLTRLRKKLDQGQCPNCDEHFPNLEEHMKTAHPILYTQIKEAA